MAFKFILGRHIKTILNDVEEKQKKDIKDYAGGHLNESVLLRAPLAMKHRSWVSAHKESIHLTETVRSLHKPHVRKEMKSPKDALYDFALGTSGVIPSIQGQSSTSKVPEIRYRLIKDAETEVQKKTELGTGTPKSLYSELEDGVLVQELPPPELIISDHLIYQRATVNDAGHDSEDSMFTSQTSFLSRRSHSEPPFWYKYSVPQVHNQGITKKDQYRNMKAFDVTILQKKEVADQRNILSGKTAARYHEQKLQKELKNLNVDNIDPSELDPKLNRVQVCGNTLDDIMKELPSLSYLLHCIKTEYNNYIIKLLDGQTVQQSYLCCQLEQLTSRGTSKPDEMAAATDRLKSLEAEAKDLLDKNQRLCENVKSEQENLNMTPEIPAVKPPVTVVSSGKEQHVELFMELENMKALILEKMDELNALRMKTRADYVSVTECTHLEQCIKETEVEVQKLLKQNEYFERSIAEMESDLKEAIIEADTSEKDARRIWRKVNSTRGMPGVVQGAGAENDEDYDDESKWNWYIS